MKFAKAILVLSLITQPLFARETKSELKVSGITCEACVVSIKAALKKLPGISNTDVNVEKQLVTVSYDDSRSTEPQIREAINRLGFEVITSVAAPRVTPVAAKSLARMDVASAREIFNHDKDKVRLVAILSPTCPQCRSGHVVVGDILSQESSSKLRSLLVWLPMKPNDRLETANAESATVNDPRISQGWDQDKSVGDVFAKTLKLKTVAWDVYMVYAPGVKWTSAEPPAPTFWMHQLTESAGANQAICLNPAKLKAEIKKLVSQ